MSAPAPLADIETQADTAAFGWTAVCALDDIVPDTGVCALVGDRQIAIFRLADDSVYAIDNFDPLSGASVLSRGIVGDVKGEIVVASPVYKQHFSLTTGRCIEEDVAVCVHPVRIEQSIVYLSVGAESQSE